MIRWYLPIGCITNLYCILDSVDSFSGLGVGQLGVTPPPSYYAPGKESLLCCKRMVFNLNVCTRTCCILLDHTRHSLLIIRAFCPRNKTLDRNSASNFLLGEIVVQTPMAVASFNHSATRTSQSSTQYLLQPISTMFRTEAANVCSHVCSHVCRHWQPMVGTQQRASTGSKTTEYSFRLSINRMTSWHRRETMFQDDER